MAEIAWGPWTLSLGDPERVAQFRTLATLARVFLYRDDMLVHELLLAETDDTAAARAWDMLHERPALLRRKILATFGVMTYPGA
jgi:hypothetical protein